MELYPAIDLRGGRCVRLRQGDFARETVYDADPVEVARGYEADGARWVHVVDLDGARVQGSNREVVVAIAGAVGIGVQTGGGVRDGSLLDAGLSRIVLGSAAVADPSLVRRLGEAHPGGVAVGLDHWGGEVKVRGWEEGSGRRLLDLVEELQGPHVAAFVVTDISVDGVGTGPDLAGYADLLRATDVPVVASGGVGSLDHLRALRDLEVDGRRLDGVIVGRALYEGAFTVREALAALQGGTSSPMEDEHDEQDESVIERMRDSGAGTEDPNIVGDVGPVDIPPGDDGDSLIEQAEPDDDKNIEA